MFIASQKKKENIAEYVLYMWQIEDIIRAYKLDIDLIKENIVAKFQLDKAKEKELTDWYESLIEMMRSENVQEAGHLQINKNVIIDLADLHKQLLFSQEYQDYTASFYKALPFITELKTKQNTHDIHDIEVALNFLYGILMLKLQHKDITEGTQKALDVITKFLVQLSSKYKQYKEGTLKLDLD
jgi:flagellin-specific chaperone FliS